MPILFFSQNFRWLCFFVFEESRIIRVNNHSNFSAIFCASFDLSALIQALFLLDASLMLRSIRGQMAQLRMQRKHNRKRQVKKEQNSIPDTDAALGRFCQIQERNSSNACVTSSIISLEWDYYYRQLYMNKKKEEEEQQLSAFTIYYKYEGNPQYPYLLALTLQKTDSQLELSRAMKLLGDWVGEYEQMSQVIKYKYAAYISKIHKILLGKFEEKAPVEYCVSRFFLCFYPTWKEFNCLLIDKLRDNDSYALSFLWYTCHSILSEPYNSKMLQLIEFLTTNYQDPLRFFDPETEEDARKILQIVYFINIYGCREDFAANAGKWALKMRLFQGAGEQETQVHLRMMIIRNRNLLISEEKARAYWILKISQFLQFLEKSIPKMSSQKPQDCQVLDLFEWVIGLQDARQLLLGSNGRYLKTLMTMARPNPAEPNFIFNTQRYDHLRSTLYKYFFEVDSLATKNRMKQILDKFTNHGFSVLSDDNNYSFLECYSEKEIIIQANQVNDILKLLSSVHIRRTLTVKVIYMLAKIIQATLKTCPFSDDMVAICLKAFSQAINQRASDPLIMDLRLMVGKLFVGIMQLYTWDDNNRSECIFIVCDDFEKNSKFSNPIVLSLLSLLVRKFGYAAHSLHKLQPLINEMLNKIVYDEVNMHLFVSLLIVIFLTIKWEKAIGLIQYVCSKNKSPFAPFYSFQASTLIKSNSDSSEMETKIASQILESKDNWKDNRVKVNLILLQMYFLRLNSTEAFKVLQMVDEKILKLLQFFYSESNYPLLSNLAAKTLPAAGGAVNLDKLKSYQYIRNISFDILARSFYKSTSICICYIFSSIILRADHQTITVKWLSQEGFLDYLYQGLNDFISKEKKISLELATTILVFKLFKIDPAILPQDSRIPDFTTIAKNVGWWNQMGNQFCFSQLEEDKNSLLLPEFQYFYEEAVVNYFKDYERNYKERKIQRQRQMEELAQFDEDI